MRLLHLETVKKRQNFAFLDLLVEILFFLFRKIWNEIDQDHYSLMKALINNGLKTPRTCNTFYRLETILLHLKINKKEKKKNKRSLANEGQKMHYSRTETIKIISFCIICLRWKTDFALQGRSRNKCFLVGEGGWQKNRI